MTSSKLTLHNSYENECCYLVLNVLSIHNNKNVYVRIKKCQDVGRLGSLIDWQDWEISSFKAKFNLLFTA